MPKLPQQLLNSLNQLSHFNEEAFVEAHKEEHLVTSIRLNPFKPVELDFATQEPVKWNSQGFYLASRPSFTLDPLFHAGCYYVQEAGSMFLEFALNQTLNFSESLKILDVCASPGGKSTLINSLLNEKSLLVANEIIKSRADVLAHNLSKWGTANTVVTNNDPRKFSELVSFFDAVVIDAPCSGSGLFRKQPEAIDEWSADHVNACTIRQHKILEDILPCVKEGGIIVYSTCSYSVEENEALVSKLIEENDLEYLSLPVEKSWGIVETNFGYRFYPHLTKSEGFFCSVLRKKVAGRLPNFGKNKNSLLAGKTEQAILYPFLGTLNHMILKKNNQLHLMNEEAANFMTIFEKHFYLKKAGVVAGEIKGKDLVPNQELAWFTGLNGDVQCIELDKETALKFLRKESFSTPGNVSGLTLMQYKRQGLDGQKYCLTA